MTVLERTSEVRPVPRTLIVTDQVRDLLGPAVEPAIRNQIHRFELFADGRVASVPLRRPDLIVERSAIIEALHGEATAAGVSVAEAPGLRVETTGKAPHLIGRRSLLRSEQAGGILERRAHVAQHDQASALRHTSRPVQRVDRA